jgi:hypothetical protein
MFELEEMEPIDPQWVKENIGEDGTFNPFRYDLWNMGREFSKDIYFMYSSHASEEYRDGYFVNVRTGERQRLVKNKGEKDA